MIPSKSSLVVPYNPRRPFAGPSAADRSLALQRHKAATAEEEIARLRAENDRLRKQAPKGGLL